MRALQLLTVTDVDTTDEVPPPEPVCSWNTVRVSEVHIFDAWHLQWLPLPEEGRLTIELPSGRLASEPAYVGISLPLDTTVRVAVRRCIPAHHHHTAITHTHHTAHTNHTVIASCLAKIGAFACAVDVCGRGLETLIRGECVLLPLQVAEKLNRIQFQGADLIEVQPAHGEADPTLPSLRAALPVLASALLPHHPRTELVVASATLSSELVALLYSAAAAGWHRLSLHRLHVSGDKPVAGTLPALHTLDLDSILTNEALAKLAQVRIVCLLDTHRMYSPNRTECARRTHVHSCSCVLPNQLSVIGSSFKYLRFNT